MIEGPGSMKAVPSSSQGRAHCESGLEIRRVLRHPAAQARGIANIGAAVCREGSTREPVGRSAGFLAGLPLALPWLGAFIEDGVAPCRALYCCKIDALCRNGNTARCPLGQTWVRPPREKLLMSRARMDGN